MELLKLTTVLIEHLGTQLVEHRKELIKFAWNHLKSFLERGVSFK